MLADFFDAFFGCWHTNSSFPITVRGKRRTGAASLTGTYVVCLDCGKEFPYDWNTMRVVTGNATTGASIPSVEPTEASKAA
jgi:hypothetical protein